jgi:transposase InsO family protein
MATAARGPNPEKTERRKQNRSQENPEPRSPQTATAKRRTPNPKPQSPNEVWTVDFKGWWRWGEAGRCEPLTVRDEFSRYVLELRAMENARSQTVREAFERVFERHGLPEAIRSDTLGAGAVGSNSRLTHNRLYPGRPRCCDVTDLYQAFSQRTGPGRLWISLGAGLQPTVN